MNNVNYIITILKYRQQIKHKFISSFIVPWWFVKSCNLFKYCKMQAFCLQAFCCIGPWLPSWLDRGALINANAPGCDTSVVRDPTGHK